MEKEGGGRKNMVLQQSSHKVICLGEFKPAAAMEKNGCAGNRLNRSKEKKDTSVDWGGGQQRGRECIEAFPSITSWVE